MRALRARVRRCGRSRRRRCGLLRGRDCARSASPRRPLPPGCMSRSTALARRASSMSSRPRGPSVVAAIHVSTHPRSSASTAGTSLSASIPQTAIVRPRPRVARRLAASTRAAAGLCATSRIHSTSRSAILSNRPGSATRFETARDRVTGERQTRSQLAQSQRSSSLRCRAAPFPRAPGPAGRRVVRPPPAFPSIEVPASAGSRDFAEVAPAEPEQRTLGVRRLDQRVWRRLARRHTRPVGRRERCLPSRARCSRDPHPAIPRDRSRAKRQPPRRRRRCLPRRAARPCRPRG